ncbi:hypothetical protein ES703_106515 [subsurface metagenome]
MNLYEYVNSRPSIESDPSGLVICNRDFEKTSPLLKKSVNIWLVKVQLKCRFTAGYKWVGGNCKDCKVKAKPWDTMFFSSWGVLPPYIRAGVRRSSNTVVGSANVELRGYYDAWHNWGNKITVFGFGRVYDKKYSYLCCKCAVVYARGACEGELKINEPGKRIVEAAAAVGVMVALVPGAREGAVAVITLIGKEALKRAAMFLL